ncbi:MAG: LysM peptidoglycan-binding domain-containing protein [Thermoguttaceae bacterium]
MEKEAKIGLSVIFALLMIFAAALGFRMYESRQSEVYQTRLENTMAATAPSASEVEKKQLSQPALAKNIAVPVEPHKVVVAVDVQEQKSRDTATVLTKWNTTPELEKKDSSAGDLTALKTPPTLMPLEKKEKPKAKADNRYILHAPSDPFDDQQLESGSPRRSVATRSIGPARVRQTYTVTPGDSLFDIARAKLGKASRWVEIYELNRDRLGSDLDSLPPGLQIALP